MSSSRGGRVMGRGRSVQAPVEKSKDPISDLTAMLQKLHMNADQNEKLLLRDTALQAAENVDKLAEIAVMLLNSCATDWHLAAPVGDLCCQLAAHEPNGKQFRDALFIVLRAEQNKMNSLTENRVLSFTALVCQLLLNMRQNDGSHINPLANVVTECLAIILHDKSSDNAVLCAAEQLRITRDLIIKIAESTVKTKLKNGLRQALSNDRGGRAERLQLLDDFELLARPIPAR